MPSAFTMLKATQAAIQSVRGSGMAGLEQVYRLGPQARGLANLIVKDSKAKDRHR